LKPVRLSPEAARELNEAAVWYESRQSGLARRFLDEFDALLSQIGKHPAVFPRLADMPEDLVIRRSLMNRFPYALVFLELQDDIRIVAWLTASAVPVIGYIGSGRYLRMRCASRHVSAFPMSLLS
jgi:plasmid stabilization system protein ParE